MEVCPVNPDCPGFVCTTDITFPRFENYRLRRESKGVKYFLVTCAKKMREKKKTRYWRFILPTLLSKATIQSNVSNH